MPLSPAERQELERQQRLLASGQDTTSTEKLRWFQVPVGRTRLRVLATGKIISRHYGLPGMQFNPVCWQQTYPELGLQCPVCRLLAQLDAAGHDTTRYRASRRGVVNALIRGLLGPDGSLMPTGNADADAGRVCLVSISEREYSWFVGTCLTQEREGVDILDWDTGHDIILDKYVTKNGKQFRYNPSQLVVKPCPVHPDPAVRQRIRDEMYDLQRLFPTPSADTLAQLEADLRPFREHFGSSVADPTGTAVPPVPRVVPMLRPELWAGESPSPQAQPQPKPMPEPKPVVDLKTTPKTTAEAAALLGLVRHPSAPATSPPCFGYHARVSVLNPELCFLCLDERECKQVPGSRG